MYDTGSDQRWMVGWGGQDLVDGWFKGVGGSSAAGL